MILVCVVISDLYLFEEIVLLNIYFIYFKNFILSLIDKVRTATWSLALFIWNVAPVVYIAFNRLSPLTPGIIDMSDIIIHSFDHDKWSSVLQLIKDKSKNLQKILKYFSGTTNSCA